jgi:hypothetical protein
MFFVAGIDALAEVTLPGAMPAAPAALVGGARS